MQDFLFELVKAGLYNLNVKFNFQLQIKEVHAPLFSVGVLYREAFSLQTKGETLGSSRTAISSISLTFGCSDIDRKGLDCRFASFTAIQALNLKDTCVGSGAQKLIKCLR
jgi:hypothetical protein